MYKNKILIKILILIFTVITFNFSNINIINADANAVAVDNWGQCYVNEIKKLNQNGGDRDSAWFNIVYKNCKDTDSVNTGTYTFSNGDKVSLITIRKNAFSDLKNDLKLFSSFEEYHHSIQVSLNSEIEHPDEYDISNTVVACFNSFKVILTKRGNSCNSDTLPSNTITTTNNPTSYNQAYVENSNECGYTLDPCINKRDTEAPTISATLSSDEWKKSFGKITLSVGDEDYSTGIDYSKYSWESVDKCLNNGTSFTNGTKIDVPGNGINKLYLCAADNINPIKDKDGEACSPPHTKTWTGTYKLDSCSPEHPWNSDGETCDPDPVDTCNYNSKPNDSLLTFNNTYDNQVNGTIDYTHNGEHCGFVCSEGTWNGSKCYIPVEPTKTCNENTKPLQENNTVSNSHYKYFNEVFSNEDNAEQITYTRNGDYCNYKKVCDKGYSWNQAKTECIKSIPIIEIGLPYTNLLAQNYNYKISINTPNDSAPIEYIKYKIEDEDTGNLLPTLGVYTLYPSDNWTFTWPMTKVDNFRLPNGSREYTLRIVEICDEAGNCSESKDYIHNVYANTNSFPTFGFNNIAEFTSGDVADGTINELKAVLKGEYGNEIVKASPINRTIDFNFDTSHNLNKNQFNNNGNAIVLNTPNDFSYSERIGLGNNITKFSNQKGIPNNGEYKFNFKVYSPTNLSLDTDDHDFIIKGVTVDINQSDSNPNIVSKNKDLGNSSVDFNFKPLYTTEFSGDQKDNGFIAGVKQTGGYLDISKKATKGTSNLKIKLIKSGDSASKFSGKGANNSISTIYTDNSLQTFYNNVSPIEYNFTSLFDLIPNSGGFDTDLSKLTVNSWINYKNDGKEVTYIGDFVGDKANAANAGLKVQGNTNIDSSKQQDITVNQNEKGIHNIAGKIDKASLRGDLKQKVFSVIKNISTNSSGVELMNGKVKYYDYSDETTNKIKNLTGNIGDKTIVVLGADVYITGDLKVGGIIILKDDNGNGGKLYIDPEVSRIDAIIYADKSILSYNTTYGEISPNNGGTYEILKKQLFIKGSVFSENTIGGSRKDTPVCPFYLNYSESQCSLDEAQKYDLNYLRRGIIDKNGNIITEESKKYPVIIEYNSQLQLNPPALFGN